MVDAHVVYFECDEKKTIHLFEQENGFLETTLNRQKERIQ